MAGEQAAPKVEQAPVRLWMELGEEGKGRRAERRSRREGRLPTREQRADEKERATTAAPKCV
jgi:hypothetical protein